MEQKGEGQSSVIQKWTRARRKKVMKETQHSLRTSGYVASEGIAVKFDETLMRAHMAKSIVYSSDDCKNGCQETENCGTKMLIEVIEGDSIDVGLKLYDELNSDGGSQGKEQVIMPLVLIMANGQNPGGGYLEGDAAQEESIFRRTAIARWMGPENPRVYAKYPIPEFGGVYLPSVPIFRENEREHGYAFMKEVRTLSFVAAAAYPRPPLVKRRTSSNEEQQGKGERKRKRSQTETETEKKEEEDNYTLPDEVAVKVKRKIQAIFNIAQKHGHRVLVLGPFGCGAFRNPAKAIAELFKEVLAEARYSFYFTRIVFAILEDSKSLGKRNPVGNLAAFRSVFAN